MIDFLHVTKVCKEGGGIREVDCSIDYGEIVVIEGPSGSGKTTFLRLLTGTQRPDSGRIVVSGTSLYDLSRREMLLYRRQLGYVSPELGLLSDRSLLENVALPLYLKGTLSKKAIKHKALDALSAVGLSGRAGHRGEGLSVGETMRACFARALANEPALLLLAEPLESLDRESMEIILDAILDEQKQGVTVLVTATNSEPYRLLVPRRMWLSAGRLIDDVRRDELPLVPRSGSWLGIRP